MNNLVEQVARGAFGFLGNRKGEDMMRLQRAESAIEQLDGRHGWKLVPVEPTETQGDAGILADGLFSDRPAHNTTHEYKRIYIAMCAAGPDPLGDSHD